jgi:hypothetical protein
MRWSGQHIYDLVAKFRGTNGSSVTIDSNSTSPLEIYQPVVDASPKIKIGSSDTENLTIRSFYQSGTQTLQAAIFTTNTASGVANYGLFRFNVDGTNILDIDDGGIDLDTNKGISINGTDILTDSSGTATLSNIDAGDITLNNLVIAHNANDYATFAVADTGDLTISTTGDGTRDSDLILDADGQIKLEPVDGNNILLDGTIAIDAGVVTGATSITSTAFVGGLTGQADTVATIAGLAPNTATTQATQAAITTCANLVTVGTIGTGVWNGTKITDIYTNSSGKRFGSTIKILPSDFMINDDAASPLSFKDGSNSGVHVNDSSSEAIAFVTIPEGMKATLVDVYGTHAKTLKVWEVDLNASFDFTGSTIGTGSMNTQLDITDTNATATNYLAIQVTLTETSQRIWGGIVTIAPQ